MYAWGNSPTFNYDEILCCLFEFGMETDYYHVFIIAELIMYSVHVKFVYGKFHLTNVLIFQNHPLIHHCNVTASHEEK
jgi:hypothetical protein